MRGAVATVPVRETELARGTTDILLLLPHPRVASSKQSVMVLWEGPARGPDTLSLIEYIDTHAEEIRERYLAWAHDLGQVEIFGRPLSAHFRTRRGSLWSLSPFVEQSLWKQRSLELILKVIALEMLLHHRQPSGLRYIGANRSLNVVLDRMCADLSITYQWERHRSARPKLTLRRLAPAFLGGAAALAYLLVTRFRLPRPDCAPTDTRIGRILICAPFFNHNADRRTGQDFVSQYWTTLPRMLAQAGFELHWLHTFYPHAHVPSASAATRVLERIRSDSPWSGRHSFVDAFLTPAAFIPLIARWLALCVESWRVGAALRARSARFPRESFWPLIRSDWAHAFRGPGAALGLFYAECFDRALERLPHQDHGIHLMEGQGWERALARAWHRHGHGRLAGVVHATIRFWDLRYHCDPRRYSDPHRERASEPDVVVVNGRAAAASYLSTHAPREALTECEALRYLHLRPCATRNTADHQPLRLLVLGDFLRGATDSLLKLVRETASKSGRPFEVWLKSHPNAPIEADSVLGLNVRLVDRRIAELLNETDLALASNTTSSALEVFVCGGRVVVFDDLSGVNLSPLRGVAGVPFVRDARELREVIDGFDSQLPACSSRAADFFAIEPNLVRWRRFFGLLAHLENARHGSMTADERASVSANSAV